MNLARIKNCMCRAERGEETTIGFLGGSITQGSLAAKPENTYAYRVYKWWKESFPMAEFHYINAGIGGTNSHYGAARAVTDVLMYRPDFVIVDFSVNDEANLFFQETFEGVIRRILSWNSNPAVVILNNVRYDSGENAQDYHNAVGNWYQVPYVSIRDSVYGRVKAGEFETEELTPDGLHPNDRGHELVAAEIISFLEKAKEQKEEIETENILPYPLTVNAYEKARRLTIREITPWMSGFRADTEEKMGHLDHFKNGWIGRKAGDKITFELDASCIAVQYRKTICKPAVRAQLVLDGDMEHPILLDGNFDEDWGDCLYLETILHHGERRKHTIEIEVLETEMEKETPFYLISVIVA